MGVVVGLALGLSALLWTAPVGCSGGGDGPAAPPAAPPTAASKKVAVDPAATAGTPEASYLNTNADVAYVGDAACVRCHAEISASFRKHPMGRSLAPVPLPGLAEKTEFRAEGFEYSVEPRDGRVFHREVRRDAAGKVVSDFSREARYVLGSGTRGYAFLIEHDGYLVQSPIAWYSQQRKWDLAPGYHEKNEHFERQVTADCLFCHANQVEPVRGTLNRYQPPIFRGYAIGCERCHGPGSLHVKREASVGEKDPAIVNPRDLPPKLREAVCEQCHLQGETRFPRAGHAVFDYRPGLPLGRFWAVFDRPDAFKGNKIVGHVEQMRASRCFQMSAGKLGCISCHDPHELPAPPSKTAYYRERCLECHADRGCTFPKPVRRKRSPDDNCIECHMPRSASNVVHTSQTIHRILRFGEFERDSEMAPGSSRPDNRPLVDCFESDRSPREDEAAGRDLALALTLVGDRELGTTLALTLGRMALPLAESAAKAQPDDPGAWLAKAGALRLLGRNEEALAATESLLAREPNHEGALVFAGVVAGELGRNDLALAYWRRLLVVNPWLSRAHLLIANLHAASADWPACAEACRAALRLNPARVDARKRLVECLLKMGDTERARSEAEIIKAFEDAR